MVKISDLNFSVETPTLDLTPAPLDVTTNLPIEDSPSKPLSSMKLREVSSPKLGKYAGLGLINLTSSAGTDFTITSAKRESATSHHGTGNAIDFGVKYSEGDGKDMINYFFDDEEATSLSERGLDFLRNNNAELIDERTNADGSHFHLEFNTPEGSTVLGPKDDQPFYEKGDTTNEGYKIYGVKDSYKTNDYNSKDGYSKAYDDLADEDGYLSIDLQGDFYKNYGMTYEEAISGSSVAASPEKKSFNTFSNLISTAPKDFGRYSDDPYKHYSNERASWIVRGNLLGANRDGLEGYYPIFKHKSEAEVRRHARTGLGAWGKQGIDIWPGTNITEDAAIAQSGANKFITSFGNLSTSFVQSAGSTMNTLILGAPSAIAQGRFSGVFANPGNEVLDRFKSWYKEEYPVHASKSEDDQGFLESIGTANFWATQGMDGVGFLLGAAATGGVAAELKVAEKLAKVLKIANPKNYARVAAALFRKSTISGGFQVARRAIQGSGLTSTRMASANFIGAGLISATGEASIEAQQILKQSISLIKELQAGGDPRYQGMDNDQIRDMAASYANVAWGLNVITVGASNLIMFKNLFGGGTTNLKSKYIRSLIGTSGPKLAFKEMGTSKWVSKWAANWFKRPATEMTEEWVQYALEIGAKDYFKYEHNPDKKGIAEMLEGGMAMTMSMAKGFYDTPQELHGQQAMFLGALLGKLGEAGGQINGNPTEWQTYKEKYDRTKAVVDELNPLIENGSLYKHIKHLASLSASEQRQREALEVNDTFKLKTEEAFKIYETIALFAETGQLDILKDMLDDVAKMDDAQYAEAFGIQENSEEDPSGLPVNRSDVNKEITHLRDKIEDYEENLSKITEGISNIMPLIVKNLKGKNVSPEAIFLIQKKLGMYSFLAKDYDRRIEDINAELLKITAGILNMEGFKGVQLTKRDLNNPKVLEEIFTEFVEKLEQMSSAELNLNNVDMQQIFTLFQDGLIMARELQSFQELITGIYNNPTKEFDEAQKEITAETARIQEAEDKAQSVVSAAESAETNQKEEDNKEKNEDEASGKKGSKESNQPTKPEEATTPSDEKGSEESNKPKGFNPEKVVTPFDLSSEGEAKLQELLNSPVSFLRTTEKSLEVMFRNPETFKYLVPGRIIKNDGRELYDTALQGLNSESTIKFHRNLREHKEILDNAEVGINKKFKADEEVVKLKDLLVEYPFLVPALNYVLKTMDTRWKASSEKVSPKPNKPEQSNKETTTKATERDTEVPSNDNGIQDNEDSLKNIAKEDDTMFSGVQTDEPVKLSSILTGAWKSVRNFFGNNPGTDTITSDYLEDPKTGDISEQNKDVVWGIDFDYIEMREGGEFPSGIVNKLKNKENLTEKELKMLPIKGKLLTKDGVTLTIMLHIEPYIYSNMSPKKWDEAKIELNAFRQEFYKIYQRGGKAITKIDSMNGGHLDVRKGQKNNLATVLNGGRPRVRDKQVSLVFNDGTDYVDNFGRQVVSLAVHGANPKSKGAVYMPIEMNNGAIFPLRVFVENVSRPTAELLYTIFSERMTKKILLNDIVTEKWINEYIKSHPIEQFTQDLFAYISGLSETPTFSDVLNMLVYESGEVTDSHMFRFDVKNNLLKLGNIDVNAGFGINSYSLQDIEDNKESIIDWFVENKRYNVQKSRTSDLAYVNLLVENTVLHTNAYSHPATGVPFIQPSLRLDSLMEEGEYTVETNPKPQPQPETGAPTNAFAIFESADEKSTADVLMEAVKQEQIDSGLVKASETEDANIAMPDSNTETTEVEREAQLFAATMLAAEENADSTTVAFVESLAAPVPTQPTPEPASPATGLPSWMDSFDDGMLDDIDGQVEVPTDKSKKDDDQNECN